MIDDNEPTNAYLKARLRVPADYEDSIVHGIENADFKGSHITELPDSMIELQLFFGCGVDREKTLAELKELIREAGNSVGRQTPPDIKITLEKAEDWIARNRASFHAIGISANLVVLPP